MGKFIFFTGEITGESVEMFIDENEINDEEDVNIVIDSEGGAVVYGEILTTYLNSLLNDNRKVTLYSGNNIQSAAVDIFFNFKGEVVISDLTLIMLHKAAIHHSTNENKRKMIVHIKKLLDRSNTEQLKIFDKVFSTTDHKNYLNGDEIYITKEDFFTLRNIINPPITKDNVNKTKKSKSK